MSKSVVRWNCLISFSARFPGRYLLFLPPPPMPAAAGVTTRCATLVRGDADRGVCFVRAMLDVYSRLPRLTLGMFGRVPEPSCSAYAPRTCGVRAGLAITWQRTRSNAARWRPGRPVLRAPGRHAVRNTSQNVLPRHAGAGAPHGRAQWARLHHDWRGVSLATDGSTAPHDAVLALQAQLRTRKAHHVQGWPQDN